jgi:hypothetical protein
LDIETSKARLGIKDKFDTDEVRSSYIGQVKAIRDDANFEALLLELNVARDTLLENLTGSREIVPVLAKELASISAKQNQLLQINDARDEIRDTFSSVERNSIRRIRSTRDFTGILSAASAALAFGKENLSEILPSLADSASYSQTLLLFSAMFGFFAFMANRRSGQVSARMDQINRVLTRDRQTNRLLLHVFGDEEDLEEMKFEDRLRSEINSITGAGGKPSELQRAIDLYGAIGLPVPLRIHLGRDFVDDYIDYLSKSGYIKTTGVSGHNMVFHKVS